MGGFISFGGPGRPGLAASPSRLPRPSRELRADFADVVRAWWLVVAVGLGVAVHAAGGNPAAGLIVGLVAVLPCFRLGRVARLDRRWLWLAVPLTAFEATPTTMPTAPSGSCSAVGSAPGTSSEGEEQATPSFPSSPSSPTTP